MDDLSKATIAFRRGEEGEGGEQLCRVLDTCAKMLSSKTRTEQLKILPLLERTMAAQQRCDLLGLADILEYELGPMLNAAN